MNVMLDWFKKEVKVVEGDVLSIIVNIKSGVKITEQEIASAFKWLDAHSGEIAAAVATVLKIVGELSAAGVGIPPNVIQAVVDANAAVAGLNALVASQQAGTPTPEALIAGYVAVKNAYNASNNATITIAQTPAVVPVPVKT